ncbi:hypothetical protein [Paracidovorax avenae]|uniref:hypothetical protein n=1 Tax=Paracidovorax avenae TaxID=80867 RepID=UPI001AD839A5|nr:hypothetical protein [Paracidovorax avenae]
MSIQQWQASIGISRTEQTTVRQALTESGVLEEMLLGRPAVMHYRLNVSALAKALARSGDNGIPTWDTVSSWFRGYHNYYKPLADIAGSVGAGLYLSLLLQRHRTAVTHGQLSNGCVEVCQDEISRALCLGPKVQRNARLRLKKAGLIQESGPAGGLVRVNLDAVLMCLRGQSIKPLKRLARPAEPPKPCSDHPQPQPQPQARDRGIHAAHAPVAGIDLSGLAATFRQLPLGLQESSRPATTARPRDLLMSIMAAGDLPEVVGFRQVSQRSAGAAPQVKFVEKSKSDKHLPRECLPPLEAPPVQVRNAVSCKLEAREIAETCIQGLPFPATYIQGDSIQTTTTGSSSGSESTAAGGTNPDELVFPEALSLAQIDGIKQLLARVHADDRQLVLDELAGRMGGHTPIKSPVGWVSGLLQRMAEGPVVFVHAEQVAMDRRMRVKLRERAEKASPRPAPPAAGEVPVDPAAAARAAAEREKLRLLTNEMRGGRFRGTK